VFGLVVGAGYFAVRQWVIRNQQQSDITPF
jgi:hypothetical protein